MEIKKDLNNLFNEDYRKMINNYIEDKMIILQDNEDFKNKQKRFSEILENLDNSLDDKLKNELDELIRYNFSLQEYYFTLAYLLGIKFGSDLNEMEI